MLKNYLAKLVMMVVWMAFSFSYISCESPKEVSEEMKAFMLAIDSVNSMDESAEPFGYSNKDMPLGYYEVKEPTITGSAVEGNLTCYDVNVKHGLIDSNIKVCWEDGKIVSIAEIE